MATTLQQEQAKIEDTHTRIIQLDAKHRIVVYKTLDGQSHLFVPECVPDCDAKGWYIFGVYVKKDRKGTLETWASYNLREAMRKVRTI